MAKRTSKTDGKTYEYCDIRLAGVPKSIEKQLKNVKTHVGGSYWHMLKGTVIDFLDKQPQHYKDKPLEK